MGRLIHMLIPTVRVRMHESDIGEGLTGHTLVIHVVWLAYLLSFSITTGNIAPLYGGDNA
jgi:hypothetical protein